MNDWPKLTYIFLTYNRANYVREGLLSTLNQEYEGEIEVIISDDCSTDNTFEVIQQIVSEYKGDKHIVAVQTPHNVGLAGNTNNAVKYATGDWFIRADDDDINLSNRSQVIGEAIRDNPKSLSFFQEVRIFHNNEIISELINKWSNSEGNVVYDHYSITDIFSNKPLTKTRDDICFVKTWSKKIFQIFGEIPEAANNIDDVCQMLRASLLGDITIIRNRPAILYRRHDGNMCGATEYKKISIKSTIDKERKIERFQAKATVGYSAVAQNLKDQSELSMHVSKNNLEEMISFCQLQSEETKIRSIWWELPLNDRWRYLKKITSHFYHPRNIFTWISLLPLPIYAFCYQILRLVMRCAKKCSLMSASSSQ
ncbi:MAG: glycosyltransferase [Akkermansia sp.]